MCQSGERCAWTRFWRCDTNKLEARGGATFWSLGRLTVRAAVAEQFLAFGAKKAPRDRDDVIALLEHEAAGDQARAPLVVIRAALSAKGIDVFLRDPVNDRADSGPHARPGTHGAGLVGGVEDKV